jgi:hypothetical protein
LRASAGATAGVAVAGVAVAGAVAGEGAGASGAGASSGAATGAALIASRCFLPIVCLASRVAFIFTTAAALVAAAFCGFLASVKPNACSFGLPLPNRLCRYFFIAWRSGSTSASTACSLETAVRRPARAAFVPWDASMRLWNFARSAARA